jgi:thiamine-phosphate pyrophosphorylase
MIYALLDFDLIQKYDVSIEQFIEKCKNLNVEIIQYRDKNSNINDVKARLLKIRSLWNKTLIINDYIELVKFADGLHIGQEDLEKYKSIENIRKKIGDKILGLSTHNKEEILEANKMDLDYIGLGAYRPTTTKDVTSIRGDELIELAKLSNKDVAIIGGVKLEDNIPTKYKVIGSDLFKAIKK